MRFLFFFFVLACFFNSASAQPANLAQATSGYLYFNRLGAAIEAHDSELRNCAAIAANNYLAAAKKTAKSPVQGQGVVGDWIADSVNGMMLSGWERAHRNIVIENCMVARGWRLMRLKDDYGKELAALDHEALRSSLGPLVGSADPLGTVAREWRNEAADPKSVFAISPRNAQRTVLSVLAASPDAQMPTDALHFVKQAEIIDMPIYATPLAMLPALKPGQAVVIIGLTGGRAGARHYVLKLEHDDGQKIYRIAINVVGAVDMGNGRFKNTLAFVVPAGEWRIQGFEPHLDFCLGAPSFTVAPSDVVFAGEFSTDTNLQPDMSVLDMHVPAGSTLASSIRLATWKNGSVKACPPTNVYALEFPGAPFATGYHWGSAVRP